MLSQDKYGQRGLKTIGLDVAYYINTLLHQFNARKVVSVDRRLCVCACLIIFIF